LYNAREVSASYISGVEKAACRTEREQNMKSEELNIEGMSCGHCVMSVKKELSKLHDVKIDDVQIGKARVQYDESKTSHEDLVRAIDEAGYRVVA
jgi:copper chaperone